MRTGERSTSRDVAQQLARRGGGRDPRLGNAKWGDVYMGQPPNIARDLPQFGGKMPSLPQQRPQQQPGMQQGGLPGGLSLSQLSPQLIQLIMQLLGQQGVVNPMQQGQPRQMPQTQDPGGYSY